MPSVLILSVTLPTMPCWGLRALFIPLGDVMGKIIYWEEKKLREEKWIGESQVKGRAGRGEEFLKKDYSLRKIWKTYWQNQIIKLKGCAIVLPPICYIWNETKEEYIKCKIRVTILFLTHNQIQQLPWTKWKNELLAASCTLPKEI